MPSSRCHFLGALCTWTEGVLVVNNSLTPSLRNDLQLEGTRPCGYYTLISSSPVPRPPKRRHFVVAPMDLPGGSPPCWGWETLDDDPLGEIAGCSNVLTAARVGASCTNLFKTLLKWACEKAMLVGLPCVLEDKVLLWDNSSNSTPLPGHGCTLTPLELTMLRGSQILSDEQVSNGV